MRRKTLVPKNKHAHSAIYYYPGFFRTKLIVGNTIVKTHDLQISSDGWLALVEQEPVPIYFKKEDYLKADGVDIGTATLKNTTCLCFLIRLKFACSIKETWAS